MSLGVSSFGRRVIQRLQGVDGVVAKGACGWSQVTYGFTWIDGASCVLSGWYMSVPLL